MTLFPSDIFLQREQKDMKKKLRSKNIKQKVGEGKMSVTCLAFLFGV